MNVMLRETLLDSEDYGDGFRSIENWAQNFWQGHNQYPHYTHHDTRHSRSIIRHLEEWLRHASVDFNDAELFILLGAVYLHDIGMQCTDPQLLRDVAKIPDEELNAPFDEGVSEEIRKAHSQLSAEMIQQAIGGVDPQLTGLAALAQILPDEYHAIALIAEGHASNIPDRAKTDKYVALPIPVRLQLLQYLLRIGDALDATKTRLDRPYFTSGRWTMARPTTKYHMLKHHYVANITVSKGGEFTFVYTIPDNEQEHYELIRTCAESPLQRHLHKRRDYFQKHGIPYMGVRSNRVPGPDSLFKMDEGIREVFTREAVEFHASTDRPDAKSVGEADLKKVVQRAVKWLIQQQEDDGGWGSRKGKGSRIACTAKVIVALLDNDCCRSDNTRTYRRKIKKAFDWMMLQYREEEESNGHPASKGFRAETLLDVGAVVHCTSQACYAYCLMQEAGLIDSTVKAKYVSKIKTSMDWLEGVATHNEPNWGWGNFLGEPERALCGYWAIRALQRGAKCLSRDFDSAGSIGRFVDQALSENDPPGLAFSSILLAETASDIADCEKLRKKCLKHLCNGASPVGGVWRDVVEHYPIEREDNPLPLELAWIHYMEALGIHALSLQPSSLDVEERLILRESIQYLLRQQESTMGNFVFVNKDTDRTTGNINTPTYEAINALSKCIDAGIHNQAL